MAGTSTNVSTDGLEETTATSDSSSSDTTQIRSKKVLKNNDEGIEELEVDEEELEEEEEEEEVEEEEDEFEEFFYKYNPYYFPVVRDPGVDEAFSYRGDPPKEYDDDGQEIFKDSMEFDKITLIRRFYDGLLKNKIDLQFARVDARSLLPMSLGLRKNTFVRELNLKGNILTLDAAFHLAEIISHNKTIQSINLTGCMLGSEGISLVADALEATTTLTDLDLSYNRITDVGLKALSFSVGYNRSLKYLNLSHNELTDVSGIKIGELLTENTTITSLDLSWNNIMADMALRKLLVSAAKNNDCLERLVMRWNSLAGDYIANQFRTFMRLHKHIREIDIAHNRFRGSKPAELFARGINSCGSLQEFNVSYNQFNVEEIQVLMQKISTKSAINHVKLCSYWVHRAVYDQVINKHKGREIFFDLEGVIGIKKDVIKPIQIQTFLLKRSHYLGMKPKKKKRRKEFALFLLKMKEENKLKPVTASQFEKIVSTEKLLMEKGLVEELCKWFKSDKKKIDLEFMLELYMKLYPETALPPKKKKKEKKEKGKKGKKGKGAKEEEVEVKAIDVVRGIIDTLVDTVCNIGEERVTKMAEEKRIRDEVERQQRLKAKYGDRSNSAKSIVFNYDEEMNENDEGDFSENESAPERRRSTITFY